jgi:hypothetical protein
MISVTRKNERVSPRCGPPYGCAAISGEQMGERLADGDLGPFVCVGPRVECVE